MTVNIDITKREKIVIDPNTGKRLERIPRMGEMPKIIDTPTMEDENSLEAQMKNG